MSRLYDTGSAAAVHYSLFVLLCVSAIGTSVNTVVDTGPSPGLKGNQLFFLAHNAITGLKSKFWSVVMSFSFLSKQ